MQLQDIRTLLVLGSGQMGSGIAQLAALHGYSVVLSDQNEELARGAVRRIEGSLTRQVERGKLDSERARAAAAQISPRGRLDSVVSADFAIEAVSERLELKLELFAALDRLLPERSVLASNTSSISITRIAASTRRPDCVVGMHFMNPVPVMQLVEVIPGLQTSPQTLTLTRSLAEHLGKTCVESQDRPGFIVNRLLIPLINEACFALQEGLATAQDIDTAIQLGLNHPLGPLALADLIGLDTVLAIAEVLHGDLGDDKYRPASVLRLHVDAGWLGKKTGRGFYSYAH